MLSVVIAYEVVRRLALRSAERAGGRRAAAPPAAAAAAPDDGPTRGPQDRRPARRSRREHGMTHRRRLRGTGRGRAG